MKIANSTKLFTHNNGCVNCGYLGIDDICIICYLHINGYSNEKGVVSMIVAITRFSEFNGKDGRAWAKVEYVLKDGSTGSAILTGGAFPAPKELAVLSPSAFKHTVEFNERGRVVGMGEAPTK
jgi:hypothetical protein